jgi:hypothetical protein
MSISRRKEIVTTALGLSLSIALSLSCGGGGDSQGPPPPIEGPYVQVSAAQSKVFSISDTNAEIECTYKRSPDELEFIATTKTDEDRIRLVIDGLNDGGDMSFAYGTSGPFHKLSVNLKGGYAYEFSQSTRTGSSEKLPTICEGSITVTPGDDKSQYSGSFACTYLWAKTDSVDYDSSRKLQNFVDLVFKFSCEG